VVHGRPGHPAVNALRLALGTLTVLPVRPPTAVDRRTAGRAMVLAPLVGLLLGLLVVAVLWLLGGGSLLVLGPGVHYLGTVGNASTHLSSLSTLVAGAVVVAVLAGLTRGMHLDGLADTADGLGAGRDADRALEVMRKGDVGPFGVVTLMVALLLQVASVERLVQSPFGLAALVAALVLSRLVLPALCSAGVPPARPEGLGATVAGTVGRVSLAAAVGLATVLLVLVVVVVHVAGPGHGVTGLDVPSLFADARLHVVALVVLPLLVTGLFARHCVRRLGGITGDVLGACVEVCFTAALLVAAI